jgi:hypothetical protein
MRRYHFMNMARMVCAEGGACSPRSALKDTLPVLSVGGKVSLPASKQITQIEVGVSASIVHNGLM